jgi:hypothetical protein
MSVAKHLQSLEEKRLELKHKIAEEMNHPSPNLMLITTLKKQKLLVKEEIQRCWLMLGKQEAASTA